MHMYTTTKQLKKVFTINTQIINPKIGVQVTFILEIKLQKYIYYQNATNFLGSYVAILIIS